MSKFSDNYWLNRTACDVLEECRNCDKTRNYAPLAGLLAELQSMFNRMESGLSNKKDLAKMQIEWSALKSEIKKLRKKRDKLKSK